MAGPSSPDPDETLTSIVLNLIVNLPMPVIYREYDISIGVAASQRSPALFHASWFVLLAQQLLVRRQVIRTRGPVRVLKKARRGGWWSFCGLLCLCDLAARQARWSEHAVTPARPFGGAGARE